jgi:hypothetical protein
MNRILKLFDIARKHFHRLHHRWNFIQGKPENTAPSAQKDAALHCFVEKLIHLFNQRGVF